MCSSAYLFKKIAQKRKSLELHDYIFLSKSQRVTDKILVFLSIFAALKKNQSLLYTLYISQYGDMLHNDSTGEINSELLYIFIFRYSFWYKTL